MKQKEVEIVTTMQSIIIEWKNARKGKMDKWLKDVPDAQEICDFLHDKSTVNSLSGRNHGFFK